MTEAIAHFKKQGVSHFIFGDIFLSDVKVYRRIISLFSKGVLNSRQSPAFISLLSALRNIEESGDLQLFFCQFPRH